MKPLVPMLALLVAGSACAGPLRDPFVRPIAPAAVAAAVAATAAGAAVASRPEPAKPHLRAILFARRGHALADINGQVLREGDWFDDWRITMIEERSVRLQRRGEDLVLLLDREKAQ